MKILDSLSTLISAFRDDERANPTIEFVIVFPVLIWIVLSTFELGWLTTQQMMLSRSLNMAIRDLRLGRIEDPTHAALKELVCDRARILKNCETAIHLELIPLTLASGIPQTVASCVDRTGVVDPVENFSAGVAENIMFVRACVVIDLIMPGSNIGAQLRQDETGGHSMVAFAAYMREP